MQRFQRSLWCVCALLCYISLPLDVLARSNEGLRQASDGLRQGRRLESIFNRYEVSQESGAPMGGQAGQGDPENPNAEQLVPKEGSYLLHVNRIEFFNPDDKLPDPYGTLKVFGVFGTRVIWEYKKEDYMKDVSAIDVDIEITTPARRVCFLGEVMDKGLDYDPVMAAQDQRRCGSGGEAVLNGEGAGLKVVIHYEIYRISLPTQCEEQKCHYIVSVSKLEFINPGESGEPEPYGYVDVFYGGQSERVWSREEGDKSFSVATVNFFSRLFEANDAAVCFSGEVKDNDGGFSVNGDDILAFSSSMACGAASKAKLMGDTNFWGQTSYVMVHYEVFQMEKNMENFF